MTEQEIKVGDAVALTKQVYIQHFQAAGLSIRGTVVKILTPTSPIDWARHWPYGITFSDRPGRVSYYGRDEIEREQR